MSDQMVDAGKSTGVILLRVRNTRIQRMIRDHSQRHTEGNAHRKVFTFFLADVRVTVVMKWFPGLLVSIEIKATRKDVHIKVKC
jgi:hypothetical protein